MSTCPLVSVCIPTYNGGRYIDAALASVDTQDYSNIEVIVVDDGSQDDTVSRVRARDRGGLQLAAHRRNRGHNVTWNATVERARGTYLKFLHQDDALREDCVSRMVTALEGAPNAGLVFSRRSIRFDGLSAQEQADWMRTNARLDAAFGTLLPVNDGRALFRRWFDLDLRGNLIGEPSAVMVRRSCLDEVGMFATHVAQATDLELWMRLLLRFDAAFIEDELATFGVGPTSLSVRNRLSRDAWLDRLWILEGLVSTADAASAFPGLVELLAFERRQAFRSAARLGRLRDGSRVPVAPYLKYARYRAVSRLRPTTTAFPFPRQVAEQR